jgi:hypothetical protein
MLTNYNNSLFTVMFAIISLYLLRILPVNTIIFIGLILILFCVTGLMLLGIISVMLLDKIYRPNIPQYPFNLWLDRVIPFIFLLSPSICILILHPFEAWFTRLVLLILIHIIIIIPLFHYWAKYRRWNDIEDKFTYKAWNHPRIYKHIAIASIYPLLWGIYFSTSRYLRLGSTVNVYDQLSKIDIDTLVFLIIFFIYISIYVFILLYKIATLRRYLWDELYVLLYSIHIVLLCFYPYFRIMELIFKFSYMLYALISINGPVYLRKAKETFYTTESKSRYITNYLYYHPGWFTIMFFVSLLIEIIFSGQLYYGIYTLFLYPLIRGILSCLFCYSFTDFVFDCCFSDYIYRHWDNPHYPNRFWIYFQDAEYYFDFEHEFNQLEADIISKEINKYKFKLRKKVSLLDHQSHLDMRVNMRAKLIKYQYPFRIRLAAAYVNSYGIRWTHTQAVKYHSCTALFARTVFDKMVLGNSCWHHVELIQRLKGKETTPPYMYLDFGQRYKFKRYHLIGVHEDNIPSGFRPLIEQGVIVEPYEETHYMPPSHKSQNNPDTTFIFANSNFRDKRTHFLDQKTSAHPGLGRSLMLSEITVDRYQSTLNRFPRELRKLDLYTDEIKIALNELKDSYFDFKQHQLVWAKNLHLFPSNYIPPLKLPQNFSYSEFTPEALREIKISEMRMKRISDYLYFKKVPQTKHGTFPKEALDLMNDSQLQRILSEDIYIDESLTVD